MSELALLGGPPVRARPFHRWPDWDERERAALLRVLEDGSWGGYPSPNREASAFAERFARHVGAAHAVTCANGSVALELALLAAGVGPGDEVIVPAYTFVATASAVVFCGAVPVLVDVEPERYCLDPARAAEAIGPRTRALIPVHLACNMADMDALGELARAHDLVVIEDCAHAHGHRWRGRGAGTLGHVGTFSFQTTKLMTAGEGGALVTSDRELYLRAQSLVNCGRKEPGLDGFEGRLLGKNYRISEWQAAVLSAQLERLDEQTARREASAARLERALEGVAGLRLTRRDPRNDRRAFYQLIVRYDGAAFGGLPRERFLEALRAEGIPAEGDFYVPLYRDELFAMDPRTNPLARPGAGYDPGARRCPVAERAAYEETIWLPHELFLGPDEDVDDVAAALRKVAAGAEELA